MDQNYFNYTFIKTNQLTDDLIDRCKRANFDGMCITVDTIVAGNRERDHRTGFTTPPKLTLESLMSFAMRPQWVFNYFTNKKFELANLKHKTDKGTNIAKSVMEYINEQYDPAMNWKDAEYCIKKWNGPMALKGVMSVEDAKKSYRYWLHCNNDIQSWWKTVRWIKITI